MQGSGYLYTILPQLRKIYGDDTPELKEIMKTHTQFFNTSNFFNTIITGIDLAIEEKEAYCLKRNCFWDESWIDGTFRRNWRFHFRRIDSDHFWGISSQYGDQWEPRGYFYLDRCPNRSHGLSMETIAICLQRSGFL